jgi:hypothetical protein
MHLKTGVLYLNEKNGSTTNKDATRYGTVVWTSVEVNNFWIYMD